MVRPLDRADVFDLLPDACLVLDPSLVITDANTAYCQLLERTLDELVGHRITDVFAVDPVDPAAGERMDTAFRRVMASQQQGDLGVLRYDTLDTTTRNDQSRYRTRYWQATAVPVLGQPAVVDHLVVRVREVTTVPADVLEAMTARQDGNGSGVVHDELAASLAVADLAAAQRLELAQMREAMASRAVIEQAKGLVMGQRRCTEDEAFTILRRLSQDSNRKLRDVCKAVVAFSSAVPDLTAEPSRRD